MYKKTVQIENHFDLHRKYPNIQYSYKKVILKFGYDNTSPTDTNK